MIDFGTSPVISNWFMITITIGASAMIGIVCDATTHGIKLRSRLRACTTSTASTMPSIEPSKNPSTVADSVTEP